MALFLRNAGLTAMRPNGEQTPWLAGCLCAAASSGCNCNALYITRTKHVCDSRRVAPNVWHVCDRNDREATHIHKKLTQTPSIVDTRG